MFSLRNLYHLALKMTTSTKFTGFNGKKRRRKVSIAILCNIRRKCKWNLIRGLYHITYYGRNLGAGVIRRPPSRRQTNWSTVSTGRQS